MKTLFWVFFLFILFSYEKKKRKRQRRKINDIHCSFPFSDRPMSSSSLLLLERIQSICVRYIFTSTYLLGTIGSILNIILFSSKKLRANACCFCKKIFIQFLFFLSIKQQNSDSSLLFFFLLKIFYFRQFHRWFFFKLQLFLRFSGIFIVPHDYLQQDSVKSVVFSLSYL